MDILLPCPKVPVAVGQVHEKDGSIKIDQWINGVLTDSIINRESQSMYCGLQLGESLNVEGCAR